MELRLNVEGSNPCPCLGLKDRNRETLVFQSREGHWMGLLCSSKGLGSS